MSNSTKQVRLAAKLYDARDTMKRFWAERWPEKFAEHRGYIEKVMAERGLDTLEAAMALVELMQKRGASGMTQALALASCVEMLEPSET